MIEFVTYFIILIIVTEIIEYDKSWKHLLIINFGLLVMAINLPIIVDFSITFTLPLTIGCMLFGVHKQLQIGTLKAMTGKDADEDLWN